MNALFAILLLSLSSMAFGQYTTGENWVTRYLENGGKIENITGAKRHIGWRKEAKWDDLRDHMKSKAALPSRFNWNELARLQPIRNQASCGSCWAFSVTAVTESLYWIKAYFQNNQFYDLAEQTLVSSCERAGSCSGGYFSAFTYVRDEGLPVELDDPYTARNSSCKDGLRPVQKIKEWKYVGSENGGPSTEQLKMAIYQYGPISVDVNGSFGSYSSGVYTGCGSTGTNHMVNLEGWVDDPAYDQNGGGYWIMRNSWGENWGEAGYMKIVYKSKSGRNCNGIGNVGAYAVIPGLEEPIGKFARRKAFELELDKLK